MVTILMMIVAVQINAFTVVIDAGHGGNDAGALGAYTNEKSINLKVAKKVAGYLTAEMSDCKVVMTRNDDRFVTLQGRADIANKAGGDIFVSIHANSVAMESPGRTTVNGASVYTLGLEKTAANMEVARRENSVMMLEPDYTTTYRGFDPNSTESYIMFEMVQTVDMDKSIRLAGEVQKQLKTTAGRKDNGVRQAPFYVLVKTAMPSILVELDFICNPTQEKFMDSDAGSTKLARAIANAIKNYRQGCVSNDVTQTETDTTPLPATETTTTKPTPEPGKLLYKVQFMTSGNKVLPDGDSRFKSLKDVEHYRDTDGVVKYTVGAENTFQGANKVLREIKKLFPEAFVIKMIDGKRVR